MMYSNEILQERLYKRAVLLMGNRFEISIVSDDEQWAGNLMESAILEIRRIENLLTTFTHRSQTNMINANAGIRPVKVDKEVYDLVFRSIMISKLTQGAFDITYCTVKESYNSNKAQASLPVDEPAKKTERSLNYQNIVLNNRSSTVFLKEKNMRISFGAIGKGYAADRAKLILQQNGAAGGMVNADGNVTMWGTKPDGTSWMPAVTGKNDVNTSDMTVATARSYVKYFTDGKPYSPAIDRETGIPFPEIKNVTVVCESAELAHSLATSVMEMGIKEGLDLINQMKNFGCIITDANNALCISENLKNQW